MDWLEGGQVSTSWGCGCAQTCENCQLVIRHHVSLYFPHESKDWDRSAELTQTCKVLRWQFQVLIFIWKPNSALTQFFLSQIWTIENCFGLNIKTSGESVELIFDPLCSLLSKLTPPHCIEPTQAREPIFKMAVKSNWQTILSQDSGGPPDGFHCK